jgi:hypothetical protein
MDTPGAEGRDRDWLAALRTPNEVARRWRRRGLDRRGWLGRVGNGLALDHLGGNGGAKVCGPLSFGE